MGTWGVNLYQDDTALDVKEEYKYKLHMGKTNKEATEEIIEENQDLIEDIEEQSLFWFVADTQWNLGRLEEYVKNEALKYIEKGEFAKGSMLPKIEACLNFVDKDKYAIITSLDKANEALENNNGTRIIGG